jgi:hypothetical protein
MHRKMTDGELRRTLAVLGDSATRSDDVAHVRAHIAALTAERDEAQTHAKACAKQAADAEEEVVALRYRVKVLGACNAELIKERNAAESHLAAIRQWAHPDPTTPDAEWWDGYGDAKQEVRDLLGDDAPAPSEPLHCCGTTTGVHLRDCPTVEALSPLGMAPPSEMDGLRGEMVERNPDLSALLIGRHDVVDGTQPPAPTTTEALATLKRFNGRHDTQCGSLIGPVPCDCGAEGRMAALSLLERRMGAQAKAIRDLREVAFTGPSEVKGAPGGESFWDWKERIRRETEAAALADAPPVVTLEEVARVVSPYLGNLGTGEVLKALTALRR